MLLATFWGGIAATSLLIGYFLAMRGLSNRTTGIIMGFGAGALISAIAYELVPESNVTGWDLGVAFGLGAIAFFVGDWIVDGRGGADRKAIAGDQKSGSDAAIFIGTMLDNVPESIILGMSFALGGVVNLAFLGRFLFQTSQKGWPDRSISRLPATHVEISCGDGYCSS